jgi:purine-binding chemotaxis protein CheW
MTEFAWQAALDRLERIRHRLETGERDAEETKRLLAARTEALARGGAAPSGPMPVGLVGFSLGGTRFALPASSVTEAVRGAAVTPLPAPAGGFIGVTAHRGRAMSVIDLRALMGAPAVAARPRCDVLVMAAGELSFALATDGDIELLALRPEEILPVPEWPGAEIGLLRGAAASGLRIVDGDALMARLGMPAARRATEQG